jgi:hypothetical protein
MESELGPDDGSVEWFIKNHKQMIKEHERIKGGKDVWKWTVLYRHYDSSNVLLYVGITNNPLTRFRQHGWADEVWWPDVAYTTYERDFSTRIELENAETKAILSEKPLYNKRP